jgi:hypothetical protein
MSEGTHAVADAARQRRAEQMAVLAADPNMPIALQSLCAGLVELFEGSRIMNMLISGRPRVVMSLMAVYLDAGYNRRDPLSGLTVNRYKASCAAAGFCSPGRAAAMLGLMRFAGYLEPAARARWQRIFTALSHVREEGKIALGLLDDPDFTRRFIRTMGELYLARERLSTHAPDLDVFLDRKGALMMLMALMLSAQSEEGLPPRGPMSIPLARMSKRFGVSRGQAQSVLAEAVAHGLLTQLEGEQPSYVMTPRLRTAVLTFTAGLFLIIAESVALAAAEGAAERPMMEGAA